MACKMCTDPRTGPLLSDLAKLTGPFPFELTIKPTNTPKKSLKFTTFTDKPPRGPQKVIPNLYSSRAIKKNGPRKGDPLNKLQRK